MLYSKTLVVPGFELKKELCERHATVIPYRRIIIDDIALNSITEEGGGNKITRMSKRKKNVLLGGAWVTQWEFVVIGSSSPRGAVICSPNKVIWHCYRQQHRACTLHWLLYCNNLASGARARVINHHPSATLLMNVVIYFNYNLSWVYDPSVLANNLSQIRIQH